MANPRSDFLRVMETRGFIHQCTDLDGLDALVASDSATAPVTAYVGYDATADSLHVGNLVSIMMLRWFQKSGHRPIVLVGGGTTKVGDPSGKDQVRKLLDDAQIASNLDGIRGSFEQFLDFNEGPTGAILVNNDDWLSELRYIPFLRDIGRHFTINRMLGFDSVKQRLDREQPLTFLEFNYMILQSYDYLELNRRYGCALQMGGSDQWGNIVNGIELARRLASKELYGLTAPLITTSSGAKMGKSESGAVWLNEKRLSAYDYYQFWRNTEDRDVGRFLRLFTELPEDEIFRLEALEGAETNEAKKRLAMEATKLCRGEEAAARAAESARTTFEEGGLGQDLPTIEVARSELAKGIAAYDLMRRAGLAASNGEARRLIKGGGARVNDKVIETEARALGLDDLNDQGSIKISAGRKRHALVRAI